MSEVDHPIARMKFFGTYKTMESQRKSWVLHLKGSKSTGWYNSFRIVKRERNIAEPKNTHRTLKLPGVGEIFFNSVDPLDAYTGFDED